MKKKKFVGLLCAATLLSSPVLTQVAYAVEAENMETTVQEVKEVRAEEQAEVEVTPIVQQPEVEVPAVEEILVPKDLPTIPEPAPEVEVPVVEEVLPPKGVRPLPKPDVTESTEKEVVENPTAVVGSVTVTFNLHIDGEIIIGTISGEAGEAFVTPLDKPGTHAFWLVDFVGDENIQMDVNEDGTLFFTGVIPSVDTTYDAYLTVKEVAADVKVNYINKTTNQVIPTAPHTTVGGEVNEVITIEALALDGYDLVSEPTQTVTISAVGQEITFYYVEKTTPVKPVDPLEPVEPVNPVNPVDPSQPTPPVVDDNFVPTSNTKDTPAPKDKQENLAPKDDGKKLPQTGEVENTIAATIGAAMIGLFFAFTSRFKKDDYTL